MSVLWPSALKIVNEIAYLFPYTESFVKKSATLNNAASKFLRNAGHLHKGLIFSRDTFSCGLANNMISGTIIYKRLASYPSKLQ